MNTEETRAPNEGLQKASTLITMFAELDQSIQLSTVEILLYVARNQDQEGGITTGDLHKDLDISMSTASRTIHAWTEKDKPFLAVRLHPKDRRRRPKATLKTKSEIAHIA